MTIFPNSKSPFHKSLHTGLGLGLALQSIITVRILKMFHLSRPAIVRLGVFMGFVGTFFLAFATTDTILILGMCYLNYEWIIYLKLYQSNDRLKSHLLYTIDFTRNLIRSDIELIHYCRHPHNTINYPFSCRAGTSWNSCGFNGGHARIRRKWPC